MRELAEERLGRPLTPDEERVLRKLEEADGASTGRTAEEAQRIMTEALQSEGVQSEARSLTLTPEQAAAFQKMTPVERVKFCADMRAQGVRHLLDRRKQNKLADSLTDGEIVQLQKKNRKERRAFLSRRKRELRRARG